jgi:hypothetical protein
MNTEKLNQLLDKIKPIIKTAIWIGAVFAFLFIAKYLLTAATNFVVATKNFALALK